MLIGEFRKDREINAVFGKTLSVLGHAELFEPVSNLLHWRLPPDFRSPELAARNPLQNSCGAFDSRIDLVTQCYKVDWLGEEGFSAALERLALRLCVAIRGDHDNWYIRPQCLCLWQEFKTAHPRHV